MHTHWCRHAHKHATPPPQCVKVLIGMRAHVKMSIYHLPVCIYLSHKWINTHTQVDLHPQVNGHFHMCRHTNVHFQPLIQFNTNRKFHACTHTHTHIHFHDNPAINGHTLHSPAAAEGPSDDRGAGDQWTRSPWPSSLGGVPQ